MSEIVYIYKNYLFFDYTLSRNIRIIRVICLFLVLVSIKVDINGTDGQSSDETIVYGTPYDFPEYSIFTGYSYSTAQWTSAVYSSLLKRSSMDNHRWVPDLANSMPAISPNGRTFTFNLRDNLYFSNGEPLTMEDIEFSFRVTLTPEVNVAGYYGLEDYFNNNSFNGISPNSFSIRLLQDYSFPYGLLSFPIIPQETYAEQYQSCINGISADCVFDNPDGSSAISAGPFKVQQIDNQIVTLIANPYYYQADKVRTDKIIFEKIANKVTAIDALSSGSIDILDSQYVPSLHEFDNLSSIHEEFVGDPATVEAAINHKQPYFGTGESIPNSIGETNQTQVYENARLLRRAMSLIMQRELYVDQIMEGLAQPIATTMPPSSIGFDSSVTPDTYDLSDARDIMTQLGFDFNQLGSPDENEHYLKSFFNVTVLSPNTAAARNQWSADYVSELSKIGIGVTQHVSTGWAEIVPRTFGSIVDPPLYDDGGFDILFVSYSWGLDWNPSGLFDSSGSCSMGDCSNFYNSDLTETMTPIAETVRAYMNALDYDTFIQVASKLQHLLYYWQPTIPILSPLSHWSWQDTVVGVDALQISMSCQEWNLVYKTGYKTNSKINGSGVITTERIKLTFSNFFFIGFSVPILLKWQKRKFS